jgi:amino acid adenylation domain-containing protein
MKLSDFVLPEQSRADPELDALLARVNQTRTPYPRHATVPSMFAARAAEAPDAVAVVCGAVRLTYGELARRASRLAERLCDEGLEPESIVAILADRSPAMIVAMLAILEAGCAYLPLSPDLPTDRVRYMLAESEAPVLIAGARQAPQSRDLQAACASLRTVLTIDPEGRDLADGGCSRVSSIDRSTPAGLAYVMYTSGTSGQPKGVMVEHRAILRLVLNTNFIRLGPSDCILQTGALSFDAATFEVWGALLNGGRLCLPETDAWLGARAFADLVRDHDVTTVWLTAGVFNVLAAEDATAFAQLHTVLSGGEKLSVHHVNLVRRANPGLKLINGYGPTENTTFTTTFDIRETFATDIPIGRPIANTTVYILDDRLNAVPIGSIGELYTGGDGLARGHLKDSALTALRFIPHPFKPGERLYRTGDLARWRPDGVIEFLGRADDQVKIRGFRIEPGEIEACLMNHEALRQAVVVPKTDAAGETGLVAYYTARRDVPGALLREHVQRHLPHYMVPAAFMQLEALPLSRNGKVDRGALPNPGEETGELRHVRSERPLSATESTLCAIWCDAMGCDHVGVEDNFFDLGGHSLRAVRIIHLVQQAFGVLLPFTTIFAAPTVASLAQKVIDAAKFGDRRIDQPLVALNAGSAGSPIFAFPPGTADALGYAGLAGLLTGHRFHAFNFIEAETRLQEHVNLIAKTHPDGPYLLFGYSGGGNFAFRTARELERRGKRVRAVVILDASRFVGSFDFPVEEARRLALEFVGAEGVQPYLKNPALKDKVIRTIERYHAALSRSPDDGVIDAAIHLILSDEPADEFHDASGRLVCSKSAWAGATRGLFRTYQGSGEHRSMLHQPHLQANAELLTDILATMSLAIAP